MGLKSSNIIKIWSYRSDPITLWVLISEGKRWSRKLDTFLTSWGTCCETFSIFGAIQPTYMQHCYFVVNTIFCFNILKKETDRNQYILSTSCHPAPTSKAIPYSLDLRIVRTCSDIIKRDIRLQKLINSVLARVYSSRSLDAAIKSAKSRPREVALIKVPNKT